MAQPEESSDASLSSRVSRSSDLLKEWYVATLRKRLLDDAANLTPGALINADRAKIEQLVYASANTQSGKSVTLLPPFIEQKTFFATLVIALCAVAAGLIALLTRATGVSVILLCQVVAFIALLVVLRMGLNLFDTIHLIAAKTMAEASGPITVASLTDSVARIVKLRDEQVSGERQILESAPQMLCCLDADFHLLNWNKTMNRLLGFPPQEMIGANLGSLVLPEDSENLNEALAKLHQFKTIGALELRMRSKTGHAVDTRWMIDWSDTNQMFFAMGEDISTGKMLERARREYISTMAHDIKIPLSSVWISLQSLQECGTLSNKDRLLIDRADGNIERLLGLINELLDYERSAKAGKLPLTYGSVVVSEIIGEAVDSLASQAAVKNVTLSTLATQATVCADEGKLGRVIVNLISNGIKYSPAQTTIQIRAELLNDFLEFSVTDQGAPGSNFSTGCSG